MDASEKVAYWKDIARYDLETARAMLSTGRYLYAAFMSQQSVEKLLKAAYLALCKGDDPPRTHNLTYLLELLEQANVPDGTADLLARLSAYYIESRYPNYKERLSALVDRSEAERLLRDTEEAFIWLESMLP